MNEKIKLLQASVVKKMEENQILEQNLLDSNEKSRELELLLADRRQMLSVCFTSEEIFLFYFFLDLIRRLKRNCLKPESNYKLLK